MRYIALPTAKNEIGAFCKRISCSSVHFFQYVIWALTSSELLDVVSNYWYYIRLSRRNGVENSSSRSIKLQLFMVILVFDIKIVGRSRNPLKLSVFRFEIAKMFLLFFSFVFFQSFASTPIWATTLMPIIKTMMKPSTLDCGQMSLMSHRKRFYIQTVPVAINRAKNIVIRLMLIRSDSAKPNVACAIQMMPIDGIRSNM